jgi:hypothetical protein
VKVAGMVTKVNPDILGKNWIHLQDGTGDSEMSDLTITTSEEVSVGAVVIAAGLLATNKTLEKGYFFPLLLEDACLSKPAASAH